MATNIVIIEGYLSKDPEIAIGEDSQRARFTVAINRKGKNSEEADFVRVTVFGGQAKPCGDFLKKGSRVLVEGRLQTGSYEDETDGITRYTTDVISSNVVFLDKAPKKE